MTISLLNIFRILIYIIIIIMKIFFWWFQIKGECNFFFKWIFLYLKHLIFFVPPAAGVILCANSSLFRSSFSDSSLRIVPWYSERFRSTETRMSLTVALKISFREDSRKIFSSLDLAMLNRAAATADTWPRGCLKVPGGGVYGKVGWYVLVNSSIEQGRFVQLSCCRVRNKQSRESREDDDEEVAKMVSHSARSLCRCGVLFRITRIKRSNNTTNETPRPFTL